MTAKHDELDAVRQKAQRAVEYLCSQPVDSTLYEYGRDVLDCLNALEAEISRLRCPPPPTRLEVALENGRVLLGGQGTLTAYGVGGASQSTHRVGGGGNASGVPGQSTGPCVRCSGYGCSCFAT